MPSDSLRRYALRDTARRGTSEDAARSLREPAAFRRRGAWSDVDRKSVKSDVFPGYVPGRAVARDMERLLKSMERQDSTYIAKSTRLTDHIDDIQKQLLSISTRLRGHNDGDSDVTVRDEPSITDKGKALCRSVALC